MLLKIQGLNKFFGGKQVLNNIDLFVEQGEIISIIGPSGSGKSTLLKCINFLEEPSSGTIEFEGTIIRNEPKQIRQLRIDVGLVFQEFDLFEMKNVESNLILAPILTNKMKKDEAKEWAKKVLRFVGLEEKIYEMPENLSGGQKQRVAIARALMMQPKVLLLDEPTSALDPELIQEVLKVIKLLANQKTTMIIVTHQIEFAKEISNRIIFLEDGTIVEQGKPDEILNNPKHKRTKDFIDSIL